MSTIKVRPIGGGNVPVKTGCNATGNRFDNDLKEEIKNRKAADAELQGQIDLKQDLGYIVLDSYLSAEVVDGQLYLGPGGQLPQDELLKLTKYLVNKVSLKTQIYYLTLSNETTLIYFCTGRGIVKNQVTINRLTGQFTLDEVGVRDHSLLDKLDYLSSGHTGFAGIEFGSTEYWNSRPTYIPPEGMLVVYTDYYTKSTDDSDDSDDISIPGIKIGDGNAYLINKPFISDSIADLLAKHMDDMVHHVTQADRNRWDSKLNYSPVDEDSDLLIFTRN